MTTGETLVRLVRDAGIRIWSGVPCSSLGSLIEATNKSGAARYVGAANEGDAVAIAVGAWLAGDRAAAVILQNSGLGNAINPLTSLVAPSQAPLLMFVGWRGGPLTPDEPQHALMGSVTEAMLQLCQVEAFRSGETAASLLEATRSALAVVAQGRPAAVLVEGKMLAGSCAEAHSVPVRPRPDDLDLRQHGVRPRRAELLETLHRRAPASAPIVATTGKCSRELFALGDSNRCFYQVGAMGCVSSLGLGIALSAERRVIVADGDGSALMRLGAMATIGAANPSGFVHLLFDNEAHDSTGGQPTASGTADLAAVAAACGYRRVARCDTRGGFADALGWALMPGGASLLLAKISRGSLEPLGRPTDGPEQNARRFRAFMNDPEREDAGEG